MCRTDLYQSSACEHCWLQLVEPCRSDRDLTSCCQYQDNTVNMVNRLPPHRRNLVTRPCPKCLYGNRYSRRKYLIVYGVRHGIRFGSGPSRYDSGCDCFCSVM